MKNIDFIGIGAQKAGSTWLFDRLNELENVSLPLAKEIHYFDRNSKYSSTDRFAHNILFKRLFSILYLREAIWNTLKQLFHFRCYERFNWYWRYFFRNVDDEWYLSLFDAKSKLKGEITPAYSMLDYDDLGHMKEILKDGKIILFVRNPIDRAWSHYRFDFPKRAKRLDKVNNVLHFEKFIKGPKQFPRSNYPEIISKYHKVFGDNLIIGFYDAISSQPETLIKEILLQINSALDFDLSMLNFQKKSNRSVTAYIPSEQLSFLKDFYQNDINWLKENLGSYTETWGNENSDTGQHEMQATVKLSKKVNK